jgi:hypothetical protein
MTELEKLQELYIIAGKARDEAERQLKVAESYLDFYTHREDGGSRARTYFSLRGAEQLAAVLDKQE